MRNSGLLVLIGLLIPAVLWGQTKETFKGELSMGMGSASVTMTVSALGYEWSTADKHYSSEGLVPWKDVRRWSCGGESYGFPLTLHHQKGVTDIKFRHDDLVNIVDNYLKKYAGDKLDKQEGCRPES
jgi:hypothetical protein